jgi:hypothetical protein
VKLAQPVERAREQEVRDFGAAEIERERAPLDVEALARIGVLVEARAVEVPEAEIVGRKVAGHPIDDHAEARGVRGVDERARVVGRAEAARRREPAGGLIAPRSVEGVFGDRHEFDVREAEVAHVGDRVRRRVRDR